MTQGKVTSLEMIEIEMGDRGSKSLWPFTLAKLGGRASVKEQRVDGSSACIVVRYTLVTGKPALGRN